MLRYVTSVTLYTLYVRYRQEGVGAFLLMSADEKVRTVESLETQKCRRQERFHGQFNRV